jgi:hypothetical protein
MLTLLTLAGWESSYGVGSKLPIASDEGRGRRGHRGLRKTLLSATFATAAALLRGSCPRARLCSVGTFRRCNDSVASSGASEVTFSRPRWSS